MFVAGAIGFFLLWAKLTTPAATSAQQDKTSNASGEPMNKVILFVLSAALAFNAFSASETYHRWGQSSIQGLNEASDALLYGVRPKRKPVIEFISADASMIGALICFVGALLVPKSKD